VAEVAARIGRECKAAGVHYLLGPILNIVSSPLGGRIFEYYSEDPVLTVPPSSGRVACQVCGQAPEDTLHGVGKADTEMHWS
jgi:hypothetical protein